MYSGCVFCISPVLFNSIANLKCITIWSNSQVYAVKQSIS